MEGSAVPVGSNWATPTENVEAVKDTSKPEAATALQDKQKRILQTFNLKEMKKFKEWLAEKGISQTQYEAKEVAEMADLQKQYTEYTQSGDSEAVGG